MKKRIIPIFTFKGNVLVKSKQFANHRNVNSLVPVIRLFNRRNIDEIIFLNLNDELNIPFLRSFIYEVDVPITYGGNIETIDQMEKLYALGFDKLSLNSIIYENIDAAIEASNMFGKQSIVISIDVRKIGDKYICHYKNGRISTDIELLDQLDKLIKYDIAGEYLITLIDNEGMMNGFDNAMYKILENLPVRILANGGGNSDETNLTEIGLQKNIYGLCISSLFYFTQYTPNDIKNILHNNDICVVNYK